MMISPEGYIEEKKNKSYKELIKEKEILLDEISKFEKDMANNNYKLKEDSEIICPSPDVVYQCNLLYLSKLTELLADKFNKEYEWPDEKQNDNSSAKKYKYVSVTYDDDYSERKYSYKTTLENIKVGDTVLVDRNGNEAYGTVEAINEYTEETAPYPVDKTKDIIEIVEEFDDDDYDDYFDEDDMIKEYENILLNNMFGRISIKRLMKLNSPQNGQDEYILLYYPKFNTFFYKKAEDKYEMAEYNTKVISDQMFRIMEKESLEVPQKRYALTNDSDSYIRAVKYCQDNNLKYHDDTDVLDFCNEKRELYKDKPKYEEPKEFESIEEVIDYLKNDYKEAQWKTPEPSYYIENNQIIHYMGWLDYDMRIFKVWDYMVKNNYVDEQYYNREKYPEFFDEDFHKYDFDNLDIKRLSYLFLRTFNIERISEGAINSLVTSGIMLKLIERAKILKNEKENRNE